MTTHCIYRFMASNMPHEVWKLGCHAVMRPSGQPRRTALDFYAVKVDIILVDTQGSKASYSLIRPCTYNMTNTMLAVIIDML